MAKDYHEQTIFDLEPAAKRQGPVECFGKTFKSDEERREYFLEKLREKLKDPEFRKIEGFPLGEDKDILALSDPPYYTACPNPWLEKFLSAWESAKERQSGISSYHREPFASDVSEGKYDPFYKMHPYPTKVPHKAIMRYILHYTEPGDIVFDGFCGTGMTGVAAQMCGDRDAITSLGYHVEPDGTILRKESVDKGKNVWVPFSKIGRRNAVLNDLSPAASFISYNYNTPINVNTFENKSTRILQAVETECSWMYETKHSDGRPGRINYTVWSDVFVCRECLGELIFWDAAVNIGQGTVNDRFPCPHCTSELTKRNIERAWVTRYDLHLQKAIRQAKQVPIRINYSVGSRRFEKQPDADDLVRIDKIERKQIAHWFPISPLPDGFNTSQPIRSHGITHIHHFYSKRNLCVLASYLSKCRIPALRFVLTKVSGQITKRYRFTYQSGVWGAGGGPQSGTLYVPSLVKELNIIEQMKRAIRDRSKSGSPFSTRRSVISTSSTGKFSAECTGVFDYVFIDPPFGSNIMYSELALLWEEWLGVKTNNKDEAIENSAQDKGPDEYRKLMSAAFRRVFELIKPGRWMTVEFSNTKASVWNSIQIAMAEAGFIVANVSALDKKKGSFKAVTTPTAVKQDLVISAYKPNGGLEARFKLTAGSEEAVWDFVRTHLKQLPVFIYRDGQAEVIAERQNYLLFDRMVAFHVKRNVSVPMSAVEFYAGLEARLPRRDGMYFLPNQAVEYDKKRMRVKEILQLQLFVSDEASAILWLKQLLTKKPQNFQDIHPQFLKEISGWQKHEKALELSELLRENLLSYDGKGDVPSQIHSYLSSNFKELRNLEKDDQALKAKAKDRWYVPDPNKAGDLEKLRERALMREFEEYRESKQKRLKVFRLEAVRAGFKKAFQERDYNTILEVARKIPEKILQEDPKLLMWYDLTVTRSGGDL